MPSLSPPLRLALPLRYLTRGSLRGDVILHLLSVLLSLPSSLSLLTVPQYLSPSLRLSLPRWLPFSLARAKVEPNRGYAMTVAYGGLGGPDFGQSGSPGPRYGRPNVSRAGCSLAARQAPSTARRHFPSRCGHEEQRLMVPGSVRHRPTARETRGVAALPLNGVTSPARRRAPPVA